MCIILKKEVQSSVQHPPYTQAVPIPAAVGIFWEVLWFKESVYKMQLLCPVTEGSQLPQTQRISSVCPCKEAAWLPLSCSCPADAPCLGETGPWSTVNHQLWSGIQSPLFFGLSTESPCIENGQNYTSETRNRAQVRNCRSYCNAKQGFVWCPNCQKKSPIWKIQCKTNSWETSINGKTVSNIVPKCNRNVQTVNLKAVLIHAMNTVTSEPALTTHNWEQFPTPSTTLRYN